MSFRDLNIKLSYISYGDENIANSFLVPALKEAKIYKRSVGFFSSGVFSKLTDGIIALSRNGGKMQIVASPQLSQEDIEAINLGYKKRNEIISESFSRDFLRETEQLADEKLHLLATLIANGILDIKIATVGSTGIYHDKLGILEDLCGNKIVFYGSPNESLSGYENNYEKIRVVKSWIASDTESIEDECREFDALWNNTNPYIETYDYTQCAKANILKVIETRKSTSTPNASPITLRDYQEEAISAWINNDYHGFYVMATGTGKTWTAIYAAKRLVEKYPAMIVVCAPYKHLVSQWAEDIEKAFPNASVILVSSENPSWENQISTQIIRKKYKPDGQIIIISTIASFKMSRFMKSISKSDEDKLLIVDEAHRFTERPDELKQTFKYLLGLSATPFSGTSAQKGLDLMSWFGGQIFNLPIENALDRGFLVPYNYYPIYVSTTEEEEKAFRTQTRLITSCFRANRCINPDLLVKATRNRLRIISMAEEKNTHIDYIIDQITEKDHFVVYCGDGKLFDSASGEELKHIESIKRVLSNHDFKASQFTATENIKDRMELVDAFNKQEISALAAIRCLDEGINIPSIKSALILSSNDDYREFVQRRGRILRTYKDKTYANIYDVIVLPSSELQGWAKIELRRFREYARLALNCADLENEFDFHLSNYGLAREDVEVYDFEDVEVNIDE